MVRMVKITRYSVLRYSPISGEKINLGIIFSEEVAGCRSFCYVQDPGVIDGVKPYVLKGLLPGIKEEVEGEWYPEGFSIDSYIKFYINDYRFGIYHSVTYHDMEETIAILEKLTWDINKRRRAPITGRSQ